MKFKIDIKKYNIDNMESDLKRSIKETLPELADRIERTIVDSFGKVGKPKNRSGDLSGSIKAVIYNDIISVGSDSPYALIQEFGGIINGKPWLMFKIDGEFKKVKSVTIKAKPYMISGVEACVNELTDIIESNILNRL
jgi:phage gpG-like protein